MTTSMSFTRSVMAFWVVYMCPGNHWIAIDGCSFCRAVWRGF
jgi:hypothetical protein